ncbi:MAG: hypothetical protein ACXWAX_09430 [Chthoniobacterales bacterium]
MKATFLLGATLLTLTALAMGADTKNKLLHATLLEELDGDLKTTFGLETAKIYALWKGDATLPGDTVRSVWIAEDVGNAAPKNTKMDEVSVVTRVANEGGAFLLNKPEKGWALGRYRLELYVGDVLAQTLKFTIE